MAQKTCLRWTQDTRTAFLLALRLTGGVRRAAVAIGRHVTSAYGQRTRVPDFAAAWDAIVVEQQAARRAARVMPEAPAGMLVTAGSGAAVPAGATVATVAARTELDAAGQRRRRDGLTLLKRRAFLRALSETGTVAAACKRAGVSDTAVYRARSREPAFEAAWDRAVATSEPVLEEIAWERAVSGWDEEVWHAGKVVGTRRRHDSQLLRHLLVHGRAAGAAAAKQAKGVGGSLPRLPGESDRDWAARERAAGYPGGRPGSRKDGRSATAFTTPEEVDALLRAKLDRIAKRLAAKETPASLRGRAAALEAEGARQAGRGGH